MSDIDEGCDNRIRYAMSDVGGYLHFRRLNIEGNPACEATLIRLEAYLKETPLREVELEQVRHIASSCRCECGKELIRMIMEQQKMFCDGG